MGCNSFIVNDVLICIAQGYETDPGPSNCNIPYVGRKILTGEILTNGHMENFDEKIFDVFHNMGVGTGTAGKALARPIFQ